MENFLISSENAGFESSLCRKTQFGAVDAMAAPWRGKMGTAQVDLLFDRSDHTISWTLFCSFCVHKKQTERN